MNLKTYDDVFMKLVKEVNDLGYSFSYTTGRNEIDPHFKVIRMKYFIRTLNNLYAFCHELGHARERNPRLELYKKNRIYRIYSEIMAWILGYKYVKKYNLPKSAYFREALPHIKTYVFTRKRKKPQ